MMAQPSLEGMDMSKVQFRSYALHFLLSGGKASLLPFLAVYFRMLGLTALQVGIILGVGAWITMISATCWTHCATKCNKRRFLLVSSLLILIFSYSLLTIVPPISSSRALQFCERNRHEENVTAAPVAMLNDSMLASGVMSTTPMEVLVNTTTPSANATTTTSELSNEELKSTTTTESVEQPPDEEETIEEQSETVETTEEKSDSTPEKVKSTTEKVEPTPEALEPTRSTTPNKNPETEKLTTRLTTRLTTTPFEMTLEEMFTSDELEALERAGADLDKMRAMNPTEIEEYIEKLLNSVEEGEDLEEEEPEEQDEPPKSHHGHHHGRGKRDAPNGKNNTTDLSNSQAGVLDSIWQQLGQLQDQLQRLKEQLFAAVLVTVIVATMLGSPVDKLLDDTWFEFLDSTDMLEKYGQHQSWALLGTIMFPVLTSIAIEHTSCLLPGGIMNFKIHFIVFFCLLFVSFILSFIYPIYRERKRIHRQTQVGRGFRILFADCHGALYSLTAMLVGALAAVPATYLFWMVQDLDGSELVMGVCVSAAAFSQLTAYILHKWIIRKLTYPAAIVLGLLILAGRFIAYSFMSSPWLIIAGESFHGLSVGLIWYTICTYPDFRLNPFVTDRSALSVVHILYTGIGSALGCVASGILYDSVGLPHIFQGCCVISVAWAMLFAVLTKCVPKQAKVRYAKLLQDDETQSEDESLDENDWLEVALKHQK